MQLDAVFIVVVNKKVEIHYASSGEAQSDKILGMLNDDIIYLLTCQSAGFGDGLLVLAAA